MAPVFGRFCLDQKGVVNSPRHWQMICNTGKAWRPPNYDASRDAASRHPNADTRDPKFIASQFWDQKGGLIPHNSNPQNVLLYQEWIRSGLMDCATHIHFPQQAHAPRKYTIEWKVSIVERHACD
jgi:hypothetical protein|eukprot:COSAG01_NODE_3775_length_5710_cov_6.461059_9_plen_125_part_00